MPTELTVHDRFPDHKTNRLVLQRATQHLTELLVGFYDMNRRTTGLYIGDIEPRAELWTSQHIWEEPLSSPRNTRRQDARGNNLVTSYHIPDEVIDDLWRAFYNDRLDNVRQNAELIGYSVHTSIGNRFQLSSDVFNVSLLLAIIAGQPAPLQEHKLLITSYQLNAPVEFFNAWAEHRDRLIAQARTLYVSDNRNC
ncbi:hypothetical protein J4219_01875 [Candidatus Woesearchaeota archaeon]|nr:hypothetical protein [Candidatus Woesearchaeota archaeon]